MTKSGLIQVISRHFEQDSSSYDQFLYQSMYGHIRSHYKIFSRVTIIYEHHKYKVATLECELYL